MFRMVKYFCLDMPLQARFQDAAKIISSIYLIFFIFRFNFDTQYTADGSDGQIQIRFGCQEMTRSFMENRSGWCHNCYSGRLNNQSGWRLILNTIINIYYFTYITFSFIQQTIEDGRATTATTTNYEQQQQQLNTNKNNQLQTTTITTTKK